MDRAKDWTYYYFGSFVFMTAVRSELIIRQIGIIGEGAESLGNKSQITVYFTVKTMLISGEQYGNWLKR